MQLTPRRTDVFERINARARNLFHDSRILIQRIANHSGNAAQRRLRHIPKEVQRKLNVFQIGYCVCRKNFCVSFAINPNRQVLYLAL
jgi:hypothetical protein